MYSFISKRNDFIYYKKHKIPLRLGFDRVLACLEIYGNRLLPENEKTSACLSFLAPCADRIIIPEDKTELLALIFKRFIRIDLNNDTENSFDFFEDYKYIFPAFLSEYNINLELMRKRGRKNFRNNILHWYDFIALFNGLSKNTRIMEIISVREAVIPEQNSYNSDYISELRKLKKFYELKCCKKCPLEISASDIFKSFADELRIKARK